MGDWPVGSAKAPNMMLLSSANTTGCLPGSLCVRWAGSPSYIMLSCIGDSAKTDVFGKLMNEKRAGGLLSGEKLRLIERPTPESRAGSAAAPHTCATTDFLLLYSLTAYDSKTIYLKLINHKEVALKKMAAHDVSCSVLGSERTQGFCLILLRAKGENNLSSSS